MPNQEEIDVESQLRGLFQEAEDNLAHAKRPDATKHAARSNDDRMARPPLIPAQMLRPVLLGLEALVRASGENAATLGKMEGKFDKATDGITAAVKTLPGLVENLQGMLEQKNGVNQRMFDALHEELRGYKDGFLMETVQKPVICDLITLYDDLSLVSGQMRTLVIDSEASSQPGGRMVLDRLRTMSTNLQHNCEFIAEVLARLEVSMLPVGEGKLDKQTQRAVALETAGDQKEDGDIAQVVKRGFFWRGRVLRPEEVIMKKWRHAPAPAVPVPSQK